jgi:predicted small lipoprotein YifL
MSLQKLKFLVILFAILTLSSCGLKGPLYENPPKPANDTSKQEQPKEPITEIQE